MSILQEFLVEDTSAAYLLTNFMIWLRSTYPALCLNNVSDERFGMIAQEYIAWVQDGMKEDDNDTK